MVELKSVIESTAVKLLKLAVTRLPRDISDALRQAYEHEESELAKSQLSSMMRNLELAEETRRPICQDTGLVSFFVDAGDRFPNLAKIPKYLTEAVRKATDKIPLRPNAVNPISGVNSGDNTGSFVPTIEWDIFDGDHVDLTALTKGGGSETVSALAMLRPADGIQKMRGFVIDSIIGAGAQPCPPTIVGVGIAGEGATAMKLAKRAVTLREVGERSSEADVAKLEEELMSAANQTGIGPMGLGGRTTVLGIHIEYAHRHPATYAVGVVFLCYLARKASARIYPNGEVELLTKF
ncbi:MAG: fumarate hydratase [Candidatus Bathyarchaeia archaeon]